MAAPAASSALDQLVTSKVELSVFCRNLADLDVLSKSDPMCLLFHKVDGSWVELGRTERIKNNLNPDFAVRFLVPYFFEEVQNFQFRVFDLDNDDAIPSDDDFIGQMDTSLGEIMGSRNQTLSKPLVHKSGHHRGTITIKAEELLSSRDVYKMQFAAKKVENVDGFFGNSDPYLKFLRLREDGSQTLVYRTETVMDNLNPTWKPMQLSAIEFCNCDVYRPITVECWDQERSGKDQFIGSFTASVNDFKAAFEGQTTFALINSKKQKEKKGYTNSGTIQLKLFETTQRHTFVDFLKSGWEINLMTAIDFTGSNGDPRVPTSLHYRNPAGPNSYELAISMVGEILSNYDNDKKFPTFGFGGNVGGAVSHCFPLNGNEAEPEVEGVAGILQWYRTALDNVGLSGPTLFCQLIQRAMAVASNYRLSGQPKYLVLFIVTDGAINDMDGTLANIVQASSLPLSIVIVGVGNADFSSMNRLDGDNGPLSANGVVAQRDIVQFVPFNKFISSPQRLASEVLAEIPPQFLSFMAMNGVIPNQ